MRLRHAVELRRDRAFTFHNGVESCSPIRS